VWKGRRSTDKSYSRDNRLIFPKSSHRREGLAPRCRLFATWGGSTFQGLGCSPIKAVRELGSERRETVRSISGAGVRALRGPFPSTRGPGRTHLWCTSYRAHGKRWVAKCGADNCWKHLSRKPTSRWVLSYSYFPKIMVENTAKIITDSLFLQRMERQKYWESKIRSRQDEPFIITIGAKWKCSNVCSWGILTDREIWTLFLYDLIIFYFYQATIYFYRLVV
jgi:hypothetical protein